MKYAFKYLALVSACLLLAVAANAQSESVSFVTATPVSYSTTDWVKTLLFPEFDPSQGTLYEVDLSVSSGIQTTLTLSNSAESASSGTANTWVTVTVTDPNSLISAVANVYSSPAYSYSLGPGDSSGSGLLTGTGSASGSWTSTNVLNEFTGTGYIGLGASTFTQTLLANTGGNTAASQVTSASATGTVTYWYNCVTVPEPSSLLALSGMFGAAFFAIRRRR